MHKRTVLCLIVCFIWQRHQLCTDHLLVFGSVINFALIIFLSWTFVISAFPHSLLCFAIGIVIGLIELPFCCWCIPHCNTVRSSLFLLLGCLVVFLSVCLCLCGYCCIFFSFALAGLLARSLARSLSLSLSLPSLCFPLSLFSVCVMASLP